MKFEIPESIEVGGTYINIELVDRLENNRLGQCILASGKIQIAQKFDKDYVQTESSKINTFFHELTHVILDTMGESELSQNEKFVSCFSSFLAEAIRNSI